VFAAITKLQVYEAFLLAVVIAGFIQVILGFLRAGVIGDYIPNSVIKGMLAAIGLILILKQLPHFVGYDKDYLGDESFQQGNNENTFTGIFHSLNAITPGALIIGIVSIIILITWETKFFKSRKALSLIPGPLIVVLVGVLLNTIFKMNEDYLHWGNKLVNLVSLPIAKNTSMFLSFFTFPDVSHIVNPQVWISGLTIAIVASLETLLGVEAVDKLDPLKRVTPTNRELKAQGVGNMLSGLIGGLPLTSVIVRSSANVMAGAKSKAATIMHGCLLLLCVFFIPHVLNLIPLSALAAILIFTGYKLAKVGLFKAFYKKGWDQFVPFVVTIAAILVTDLLVGIVIGILVGLFFMIRSNFRSSVFVVNDDNKHLVRLRKDVSFLNKPIVKQNLEKVPENSSVVIDATRADFIDKDIIEEINNFLIHAHLKNIKVEVKRNEHNPMHSLIVEPEKINSNEDLREAIALK
jgi:MFS superfamily sulfate permease-like transporter